MKSAAIIVRNIPRAHKAALAKQAERDGTNLSAIIADLIAESCGYAWRAERRTATRFGLDATSMEVTLPEQLRRKFKSDSAKAGLSMNAHALVLIGEHIDRIQAAA